MKKTTILTLITLLIFSIGIVAVAQPDKPSDLEDDTYRTSTVNVPTTATFNATGNIDFDNTSPATDAGETDNRIESDGTLTVAVNHNHPLTFGYYGTSFEHSGEIDHSLGTTYRISKNFDGSWKSWEDKDPETTYEVGLYLNSSSGSTTPDEGTFSARFQVLVDRNGYSDPAGTYTAQLDIWISPA